MRRAILAALLSIAFLAVGFALGPKAHAAGYMAFKIVTASANPITAAFTPARSTGTWPLYVWFDATATTTTGTGSANPYHSLQYTWDFGDASSGAWTNGTRTGTGSRNAGYGPVAGHVYEGAGPYTVTLTVTDGTNTATAQTTITATNPDTTFSGTNTSCFSGSGAFTGCPSGANQVTTSNFVTAMGTPAAGKRYLFHNTETFTASSPITINTSSATPGYIGSYGTGAKAVISASSLGNWFLNFGGASTSFADWRVVDLDFHGGGDVGVGAVANTGYVKQLTILRVDSSNMHGGLLTLGDGTAQSPAFEQVAVVDSSSTAVVGGSGGDAIFANANSMMICGNNVDNASNGEHNIRVQIATGLVICSNTAKNAASGKENITVRSPESPAVDVTSKVVVADNEIVPNAGYCAICVEGGNPTATDTILNTIIERNWSHNASGSTANGIQTTASKTTIRNNLINLTGATTSGYQGMLIYTNTSATNKPDNVAAYNNTVYTNDSVTSGNFIGLQLGSSNANTGSATVQNNLFYAPNATSPIGISDLGSGHTVSNNSSNSQTKSNSATFTTTPPTTTAGFKPTCTSTYPCAQGTSVPVWSDFFIAAEPATRDLGGVNH